MKIFTLADVESLAAQLRQEWGSAAIVPEVVNDHCAGLKLHVGPRHRPDAFCLSFSITAPGRDEFVSGGISYSGALDSLRESLDRFIAPAKVGDLSAVYRGVTYRITLDDEGLFESTVEFPDRHESATYEREDRAVAACENLIDDHFDRGREALEA